MKYKFEDKHLYLFAIVLSLIIVGLSSYFMSNIPIERIDLNLKYSVGDTIGIEFNEEELSFGRVFPGSIVSKRIRVGNSFDFPLEAKVLLSDNVREFVSFSVEDDLIIRENEEKQISFVLRVDKDAEFGDYEGNVVIEFRRHDEG